VEQTKKFYVLAKNYMHFRTWCRENDISPNIGNARYVAGPEMLMGIDANKIEFVYYETWREHPQAQEMDELIQQAKVVAKYLKPLPTKEQTMQNDNFWYRLTKLDPAVFRGLIVSVVALLASVGVAISPGVPDALIAFIVVVVPLAQALWTRPAVTPNARVSVYLPDPINEPEVVEAGEAVTTASDSAIIEAATTEPRG